MLPQKEFRGYNNMQNDEIDISALVRAVKRLEEGLARYQQHHDDDQLRDGLIQRFEFTYELSHKMLKRYLMTQAASSQSYQQMPFSDLIRSGNEQGLLLSEWPQWRLFRDIRNKTSHTYDEDIALDVTKEIPAFLQEAQYLVAQLEKRLP